MKRRDFFKNLSIGTAALIVAPVVLSKATEEKWEDKMYSTKIQRADYTPEMWETAEPLYYDPYVYSMKEQAFIKLSEHNN